MFHASKYVNLSREVAEEVDEEELEQNVKQRLRDKEVRRQQDALPQARKQNARVLRQKAHTNVVAVKLGTLAAKADAEVATGDPSQCQSCSSILSNVSTLLDAYPVKANANPQPAPPVDAAAPVNLGDDEAPGAGAGAADEKKEEQKEEKKLEDGEKLWICEFCGHENVLLLDEEEIPRHETLDYLIQAPEQKGVDEDSGIIVFCIDVSGSMCVTKEVRGDFQLKGDRRQSLLDLYRNDADAYIPRNKPKVTYVSRLQAVQAAVDAQLEALSHSHPNSKVAIVTFNNEVTIVGDGQSQEESVAGDKLHDQARLQQVGQAYRVACPIQQSRQALSQRLFALEEGGQTALGPALVVSVAMASQVQGSKVIICTDGLANVALGNLSDVRTQDDRDNVQNWYEGVGNFAALNGVEVSVISITGDECSLENLGRLADRTGGEVKRVDPLNLSNDFANILAKPVIATQVEVTFLLHRGLKVSLDDDSAQPEVAVPGDQDAPSKVTKNVGNASEDTDILFEYELRSPQELAKYSHLNALPFQVQIRYTRRDGGKYLRVISHTKPVTLDREQAEQDVDVALLAAQAAQRSAGFALKGEYQKARAANFAWGKVMNRAARNVEQLDELNNYLDQTERYDMMLQERSADIATSSSFKRVSHKDAEAVSFFSMNKSNVSKFKSKAPAPRVSNNVNAAPNPNNNDDDDNEEVMQGPNNNNNNNNGGRNSDKNCLIQ